MHGQSLRFVQIGQYETGLCMSTIFVPDMSRALTGIGKHCQSRYRALSKGRPPMPTRNVNLTTEQDEFVEEIVRAGRYQNASEAMRDAIRTLQQRLATDDLKIEILRTQLKAGLDAIERGAFTEIDDADLDAALDGLAADDAT